MHQIVMQWVKHGKDSIFAAGMEAFSRRAGQTPDIHVVLEAVVVLQVHAEKSLCSQDNVK